MTIDENCNFLNLKLSGKKIVEENSGKIRIDRFVFYIIKLRKRIELCFYTINLSILRVIIRNNIRLMGK